jgi:PST family polysaccharide transporter
VNRKLASNVFWSGLEAAVSALLSFVTVFVVARLIGPAEVGVGAAAVAAHVLLWVVVNALFADALVQRANLDKAIVSSAVWASIAVGLAAATLQATLGWPLAGALGDSRLVSMSVALALPLPLIGAAGPIQGLLMRDRAYRALAGRTVVGQGIGTLVGITAALSGCGAWALVLQQIVVSAAGALALLVCSPWRLHWCCRWTDVWALLRIGLPLTASTLVQHGHYRLFALTIGATAGAAALGQVHMAFRLVDTVRDLAFTAQWRLMLPILSERQHDMVGLRNGVDQCLAWSSLLAFPLCSALVVSIQPVVGLLLGAAWAPSGSAALPLIGLTVWLFLAFPAGVALIAQGRPHYALIANIVGTTATIGLVVLIRPTSPIQAVLIWLGAQVTVAPYVLHANARAMQTGLLRPIHAGVPVLVASLLGSAAGLVWPYAPGTIAATVWLIAARLLIDFSVIATALALYSALNARGQRRATVLPSGAFQLWRIILGLRVAKAEIADEGPARWHVQRRDNLVRVEDRDPAKT